MIAVLRNKSRPEVAQKRLVQHDTLVACPYRLECPPAKKFETKGVYRVAVLSPQSEERDYRTGFFLLNQEADLPQKTRHHLQRSTTRIERHPRCRRSKSVNVRPHPNIRVIRYGHVHYREPELLDDFRIQYVSRVRPQVQMQLLNYPFGHRYTVHRSDLDPDDQRRDNKTTHLRGADHQVPSTFVNAHAPHSVYPNSPPVDKQFIRKEMSSTRKPLLCYLADKLSSTTKVCNRPAPRRSGVVGSFHTLTVTKQCWQLTDCQSRTEKIAWNRSGLLRVGATKPDLAIQIWSDTNSFLSGSS